MGVALDDLASFLQNAVVSYAIEFRGPASGWQETVIVDSGVVQVGPVCQDTEMHRRQIVWKWMKFCGVQDFSRQAKLGQWTKFRSTLADILGESVMQGGFARLQQFLKYGSTDLTGLSYVKG